MEVSAPPSDSPPPPPASGMSLRNYVVLVAAGAFITTFAQQKVLGQYPTLFLLKRTFHMGPEDIAVFFFWVTFAWNLKPLAGILTDAFPLFGTRRRHYMMLGAFAAAGFWGVSGFVHHSYMPLFIACVLMNIAMVFSSTVMGGLMVEAGQAFGAPGRMSSLRNFVQSVQGIISPLIGGYLAERAFGLTAGIAAASLLALGFITAAFLKEKRQPRPVVVANAERVSSGYAPPPGLLVGMAVVAVLSVVLCLNPKLRNLGISLGAQLGVLVLLIGLVMTPASNPRVIQAQSQLAEIFRSKTLWMAVGMLFLVYTVPGLNTALTFRQSDDLKFSTEYIGFMDSIGQAAGVAAAVFYFATCRRLRLSALLVGSIGLNAALTLLYLVYTKQSAPWIHGFGGFVTIMSEMALMDLAVRSTPRGCEALGFSLMMSVRNFGIAASDIIGTKMIQQYHVPFNNLVLINAGTTFVILLFIPLLPRAVMRRREGETG
jgi:MFS family permease